MEVDKVTKPKYFSITIDDSQPHLKDLRKAAEENGYSENLEEGEVKKLLIDDDYSTFKTDEYYFEESENAIHLSGEIIGTNGNSYLSLEVPLSDIVLMDIINHSVKKLNKLKTAMEVLK